MTTIGEPTNARSRRTHSALLDATRTILENQGFDALTMSAVADLADVSRGAVYLHFASRADLIAHLFDHIAETEDLTGTTERIWEATDALGALDRWAHHLASYHPRVMAVDRAVQRMERTDPDVSRHRARVDEAQRRTCDRLASWLADDGVLHPQWTVETASDLLFGLIATDLIERLLIGCSWDTDRLRDALALLFRNTLTRPPR